MNEMAVLIQSQIACAMITAMAMKAENKQRAMNGESLAYTEKDFLALLDDYKLHQSDTVDMLQMGSWTFDDAGEGEEGVKYKRAEIAFEPSTEAEDAIRKAQEISKALGCDVTFLLDDTNMTVSYKDDFDTLVRMYKRMLGNAIGIRFYEEE